MKSTTLLPIFVLLLSTIIVSHPPSATASVLDTDGNILKNGGSYYVVPASRGMGGGLDLAATGNETCPLTIVQARLDTDKGRPVIIASPLRIAIISEGFPLYPSFVRVPRCARKPSEWTVVKGLHRGPSALKITGYHNTVSGSFAIERSSRDSYKFTFCAFSSNRSCSDVGVRSDGNGHRRLVLVGSNDRPLSVRFKKVGASSGLIMEA